MSLKIDASSLFARRYLKVQKNCVQFYGASLIGTRRFYFEEIDCVLMSNAHELSFQVRGELFTIATRPDKPKHQAAIAALLEGLERDRVRTTSAFRYVIPS